MLFRAGVLAPPLALIERGNLLIAETTLRELVRPTFFELLSGGTLEEP